MSKTALDLTLEEWTAYHPVVEWDQKQVADRWTKAWAVARTAAQLLHDRFGARRVLVFGSLANREWFSPWLDIDLAAWGIPPDQFYQAVAAVTGLSADFEVDLVDPDECRPTLRQSMERDGIEL